jgi:hypothetical protein
MVMALRDLCNIPISCGLMIPILQLGPCWDFFEFWKKLQLVGPKCCLSTIFKNTLFTCLLQGKSCGTIELKTPNETLPKNLLLQMDNYVKDNKNRYLLAFLSLLMAREVF